MRSWQVVCVYGFLLLSLEVRPALSQTENMREHLMRVASERERIVQYSVLCKVDGKLGDLSGFEQNWVTGDNSKTEIYYEFSRIEQHYITAVRDLEKQQSPWIMLGSSGDLGFVGRSGRSIEILKLDNNNQRNFGKKDARHTKLRSFDPFAIGMVFCGDFYTGLSFEAQLGDLLNEPSGVDSKVVVVEDRISWTRNGDTLMEFDKKRGYWPTRLDYNEKEITWKIDIGKYKDYYVPTRAILTCNAPKNRPKKTNTTTISFEWLSINEDFSLGRDAAMRLSEKFAINYEK